MSISQPINGFTVTPLRTNPATFSVDTDTYHTELSTFISQIQTWTTQLNSTQTEINNKATEVSNNASQVQQDKTETNTLKTETENIYNQFIDLSNSKGLFEDTATGLINTNDGELFSVFDASVLKYDIYLNDNNVAVFKSSVYTKEYIDKTTSLTPLYDFVNKKSYTQNDSSRVIINNGLGSDGKLKSGQMLEMTDINNNYIDIGNLSNSNVKTFCLTFERNATDSGNGFRILKLNNNLVFELNLNTNILKVFANTNNGFKPYEFSSLSIIRNVAYRLFVVFADDYSSVDLYSNGEFIQTVSISDVLNDTTITGLSIGQNTFTLDAKYGNVCFFDSRLSSDDIALDYGQPELLCAVSKNTIVSPFSVGTSSILGHFPLQEGAMGAGNIRDIKNNVSYPVSNYSTSVWENAKDLSYGLQQILLEKNINSNYVEDISFVDIGTKGKLEIESLLNKEGFSLSFVINKPDFSLTSTNYYIVGSSDFGISISSVANNFSLVEDNSTLHTENINASTSYHAVIVYTGTKFILYVNNSIVYENYRLISNDKNLTFGSSATNDINADTKAKYIKAWDRKLTTFEVSKEYNELKTNDSSLALP